MDDLLTSHPASEPVRFRQQRTLARDFLDLPRKHFVLQQARNDLFGRQTLRDGECVLHHLGLGNGFDNVGNTRLLAELIFAVLEFAPCLEHNYAAHENIGLIYHALALQQIRNIANTEAARDVDHLILGERAGRFEPLLADEQSGAHRN